MFRMRLLALLLCPLSGCHRHPGTGRPPKVTSALSVTSRPATSAVFSRPRRKVTALLHRGIPPKRSDGRG